MTIGSKRNGGRKNDRNQFKYNHLFCDYGRFLDCMDKLCKNFYPGRSKEKLFYFWCSIYWSCSASVFGDGDGSCLALIANTIIKKMKKGE